MSVETKIHSATKVLIKAFGFKKAVLYCGSLTNFKTIKLAESKLIRLIVET